MCAHSLPAALFDCQRMELFKLVRRERASRGMNFQTSGRVLAWDELSSPFQGLFNAVVGIVNSHLFTPSTPSMVLKTSVIPS